MLALLADPQTWLAFVTLSLLEIILGFDNIIFISILVGRLPQGQQERARVLGLALAMLTRIALLFSIVWLTSLVQPLFHVGDRDVSGRDLILLGGGLFLLAKSVIEIHHALEGAARGNRPRLLASFLLTVIQIAIIDIVFSLDSIITAIGMAQDLAIMITAVVIACVVMYAASAPVARFVAEHPTTKMLALAFLVLIGVALVADGFKFHIPRGYIYFAIAFSAAVELFNVLARRNRRKTVG